MECLYFCRSWGVTTPTNDASPDTTTFRVTYDGNNCTTGTVPSAQTKIENVDLTLASNSGDLARTSCDFAGWNTAKDGSGTDYAEGATYTGNASVTLYAKWKVVSNLKIGFVQIGEGSDWRNANTASVKDAITAQGATLLFSAGDNTQETQIGAIHDFTSQKADAIILTPKFETGWTTVLGEAKNAGIPIILVDRTITEDASLYSAQVGSDFELEGKKIADLLVELKGSNTVTILELEGTDGASATTGRKKGFDAVIAQHGSYTIVESISANFVQEEAKTVTAAQLIAHSDINVIFAHDDDMAFGAVEAIKEAGKTPGTGKGQITVLSVDAIRAGLQAILDGDIYGICECSPLSGPAAVDA